MKSPTAEIREIRHQLAAQFDNDVDRIYKDLRRKQQESGRKYVRLPKRVEERPRRADAGDARDG